LGRCGRGGLAGLGEHPAIDININPLLELQLQPLVSHRYLPIVLFVCESLYWKRTENCRAGYGAPESTHDFLS